MPNLTHFKLFFTFKKVFTLVLLTLFLLSSATLFFIYKTQTEKSLLNKSLAEKEALVASLNNQVNALIKENTSLKNTDSQKELTTIHNAIENYEATKSKTADYKSKGADVALVEGQLPTAIDLILQEKYTDAENLLTQLNTSLEAALKAKQDADAAKANASKKTATTTCTAVPTSGYCRLYINTSGGSFLTDIVAASLSSVRVITDSANSSDCTNNCPTKALATYVSDNGGYAGMNGTYFCPPDYASCASTVGSYNSPLYNTNLAKWLNSSHLSWTGYAMIAFTSSTASFYPQVYNFSSLSGLRAAISNYPGLVQDGSKIVNNYSLTSSQLTKGNRGGIAVKGSTVYLIVTRSASVVDLADIMMSIGVTNGLNLDGGGSSALYYSGSYKVGPGRSLPNAVILK